MDVLSPGAIVLHSGGLDSTVCLLLARERGGDVISLGIDYGQRHSIELKYALRQCEKFGIQRRTVRVRWTKPERKMPLDRTLEEMRASVSPAFLPGRNAVFLALAAAEAAGVGATEIWIGVNCIDFSGYPDCKPAFIESFQEMIRQAIPQGPSIITPLMDMSKPDIAKTAYRLGLRQGDTWSCYRPKRGRTCKKCDACVLHATAWEGLINPKTEIQNAMGS